MREIKFRLHCERTGKVLAYEVFNTRLNNGYYWVDASEPEETRLCNTGNYYRPTDPFDIPCRVEFTGLKDVNGVEIYESDVVKCKLRSAEHIVGEYVGLVFWQEYEFCVETTDDHWPVASFSCVESIEVVGDIYQNQELLK